MRLLNPTTDLEHYLAVTALEQRSEDGFVYGGGPIVLGEAYDKLIAAFQDGAFLGVAGLSLTEASVTRYASELRAQAGSFLKLGNRRIAVADQQSFEWAPHLALTVEPGTYLGWGASVEAARSGLNDDYWVTAYTAEWSRGWVFLAARGAAVPRELELRKFDASRDDPDVDASLCYVAIDDVGVALAAAILDRPCLIYATQAWGSIHNRQYSLVLRWAQESGVAENVVWDRDTLQRSIMNAACDGVAHVSRDLVAARRAQVTRLLDSLVQPVQTDPLAVLGAPPALRVGPRLELGSVFDPATHYCDDYYGGGAGIEYCLPDGRWVPYHGTAHDWEGFTHVARWLRTLMPLDNRRLLDLGCGAGGFVKRARQCGFDAYGVDISARAIARADEAVRKYVDVYDINNYQHHAATEEQYDLITALDVWEHVFEPDIDTLMESTRFLLRLGGIGFFVICTRGGSEPDYTVRRGIDPVQGDCPTHRVWNCVVTKENSWLLVSGHVTIRRWAWWARKFVEHGFQLRFDLCQAFQVLRSEDPAMVRVDSWRPRYTLFVERIR